MSIIAFAPIEAKAGRLSFAESVREYVVTYRIKTDTPADGPLTVANSLGFTPTSFYQYVGEEDRGSFFDDVSNVRLEHRGDTLQTWLADIKFSTRARKKCSDTQIDDPLQEPPEISGGFAEYKKIVDKYDDGTAIVTSAGEPIQWEETAAHNDLFISQNVASLNPASLSLYRGAINADAYLGANKFEWRIMDIKWAKAYRGSCTPYYKRSITLRHDPDTWKREILDQGFMEIDGAGKLVQITDEPGRPLTTPQLLDGAGKRLAKGLDPVFLPKKLTIKAAAFAPLGLPTSI